MRKILMISLMVLSAVVGMNAQKVADYEIGRASCRERV